MIRKLEVFSVQPSAPELPLGDFTIHSDPIHIRNVEGINPVKAEITTTQYATSRGELYQGSSTPKRNIVITVGFTPDWENDTPATLRQKLYRYFRPEKWCKLRFFSDELPTVDIEGYCESVEPNIFTEDPEMQISIICPKPDFIEADATILNGVITDEDIEHTFEYAGTADTGMELRVEATAENPSYSGPFTVVLKSPTEPQLFQVVSVLVDPTQYFKLSTVPNAKRVQTIAVLDGATQNLLSRVADNPDWMAIEPGDNAFSIAADEVGQKWTMAYFNRFVGF